MGENHWTTKITKIEPNRIYVRGHRIDKLMGKITFPQAIYLILKGELPDANTGKMIDAIFVSSIDHGATPPSTLAARTIASTGSPLNAALAGGILAIYKWHGGAIEQAMHHYIDVINISKNENISIEEAAYKFTKASLDAKKRLSGFGHRYHTNDPRTQKLFEIAKETGFYGDYVKAALSIKDAIKKIKGKDLPINVDGAIAAVLCEMGFPPELGNAFFIIARTPGMIAHIYEEQTEMKPMRKIDPVDHEYIGEVYDEE